MGVRQFKPVTKSSRFRSVSDFAEITRTTPEKSLVAPLKKSGGRDNHGHIAMRRIGGGHKRQYRDHRFQAQQARHAGGGAAHRVRSEPLGAHCAREYEDGEKRYIIHPKGLNVGDKIVSGPGLGYANRKCDSAARGSARNRRAQRRAQAGQGRTGCSLRWNVSRSRRQGRRVRHASHAVDGNASRSRHVPRDDRRRRQCRARALVARQGGQESAGSASVRRFAVKS